MGYLPERQQEKSREQVEEATPFHLFSSMIKAVKPMTLVSGHFQAFSGRPALAQVWRRKVAISQLYWVAT
jgi:hypothetical protein